MGRMLLLVGILVWTNLTLACEELSLGLWTHHFKDRPYNENHNLVGCRFENDVFIGGYENSHDRFSSMVGYKNDWWSYKDFSIASETALVTGYPSKMHLIGKLVLIPSLTVTQYLPDIDLGISVLYVYKTLYGVSFRYRI